MLLLVAGVLSSTASAFAETKTETFLAKTASEQEFKVPPDVSQIEVTAVGGAGKSGDLCDGASHSYAGGAGAKVSETLAVSEGKTLYIDFGGGGKGGAEANCPGSAEGGGASDVRAEQGNLKSRLVVAGGGGGGGSSVNYGTSGLEC